MHESGEDAQINLFNMNKSFNLYEKRPQAYEPRLGHFQEFIIL